MVGEQPYKNRDKAGSDSGLGHLLVNKLCNTVRRERGLINALGHDAKSK